LGKKNYRTDDFQLPITDYSSLYAYTREFGLYAI